MRNKLWSGMMVVLMLAMAQVCYAEEMKITSGDSIQKILEGQKGKRVTLRLQGNDELTGKVRSVTKELVQLGELVGREFFDAVVDVSKVSAVIVRTRDK